MQEDKGRLHLGTVLGWVSKLQPPASPGSEQHPGLVGEGRHHQKLLTLVPLCTAEMGFTSGYCSNTSEALNP